MLPLLLPFCAAAQPGFLKIDPTSKVAEHGLVLQVGGGVAAVNSDICKTPDCNRLGPSISLGALYKLSPNLAISSELDYVRLGATEDNPRRPLNVSFRSEVIGLSGAVVVNLKDSYSGSGNYRSLRKRFVVPYVKVGAGLVYYTPTSYPGQGNLNDSQYTYDSERNYPAVALLVPLGGGLRFRFSDKISVAPELVYYITSTDYLDNIGPRLGDGSSTDHYGVAAVKVLYTPSLKNKIFSKFR
ncbi:outer membrane beta-barrel protein [Botryobacter ruber]|uniref:outer membrane beta-barrel protein n=1 Tax=Botryobacter ruber TaxID=2171629 RepID=UPI001F0CD1CC|nr:outer membrane beta-barrel protein [Botryobacter ruber]